MTRDEAAVCMLVEALSYKRIMKEIVVRRRNDIFRY